MFDLTAYWYQPRTNLLLVPLIPFEKIFSLCVRLRRFLYKKNILYTQQLPVPIIVVGNITVGGTGKTPMVMALVHHLKSLGYKPGIISRGVGGKKQHEPYPVLKTDNAKKVGDEALLLSELNVPIVLCVNRAKAAQYLLDHFDCDLIISDDGLQHYRLARQIEVVMVDAARSFGNRRLLPAGPLRESIARLGEVDYVVYNDQEDRRTFSMQLQAEHCCQLTTGKLIPIDAMPKRLHAVAAIGNPKRYFDMLEGLGFDVIPHLFKDHYHYCERDLQFEDDLPVLMTAKDAVKCRGFVSDRLWYLQVNPVLNSTFKNAISNHLNQLKRCLHE